MLSETSAYFQREPSIRILDPTLYEERFDVWRLLRRNFNAGLSARPDLPLSTRPTCFEILDVRLLDASAYLNAGRGLIGINFATLLLLQDYFCALLSHPDLFPDIGDPNKEVRHFTQFTAYETADESHCPRYTPQDPVRAHYAWLLIFLCLEYMFLHETTHILAGHHLYLRKKRVLRANSPLRMQPRLTTIEKARLYQTVEYDADRYAFYLQSEMVRRNEGILCDYHQQGFETEAVLRAVVVAMVTYFLFIDTDVRPLEYYATRDHPHPFLRISAFIGTWSANYSQTDPTLLNAFDGAISTCLEEALDLWGNATSGGAFRMMLQREEPALSHHLQEYEQALAELLPSLSASDLRLQAWLNLRC